MATTECAVLAYIALAGAAPVFCGKAGSQAESSDEQCRQ